MPLSTQAIVLQKALEVSEEERGMVSSSSALIVAYVVSTGAWMQHPNEYNNLRDYIRDFEPAPSESTVSYLYSIGAYIVPYCDSADIPIRWALSSSRWAP